MKLIFKMIGHHFPQLSPIDIFIICICGDIFQKIGYIIKKPLMYGMVIRKFLRNYLLIT